MAVLVFWSGIAFLLIQMNNQIPAILNTSYVNLSISVPITQKELYPPKIKGIDKPGAPGNTIIHEHPSNADTIKPTFIWPACLWNIGWVHGWHGSSDFEYGVDFDCSYHTRAPALWAGRVIMAQRTCWNISCTSTSGGVVVIVAWVPGMGYQSTYYLHLDSISVQVGEYVDKDSVLGLTGGQLGYGNWPTSPWYSSGPHEEIGWCAPFLPCPVGANSDPTQAIREAIST